MDRPRLGDIADILQPAQVLLIEHTGLLGTLIQRTTGSRYTHAALVDQTAGGFWIVVEAVGWGVQAGRLEDWLSNADVPSLLLRDLPEMGLPDRNEVCRAMWLAVGQGYDALGLLGFYLRRRLGLRIATRLNADGRRFCSEGVSLAFSEGAGIRLTGFPAGLTSPGDLERSAVLRDIWRWGA